MTHSRPLSSTFETNRAVSPTASSSWLEDDNDDTDSHLNNNNNSDDYANNNNNNNNHGFIMKRASIAFWFMGLLNNSPYVIFLSTAKSISEGGTALVFLANVLPSLTIKLSAPYWFDRVSCHVRMVVASGLMLVSFLVVATFSFRGTEAVGEGGGGTSSLTTTPRVAFELLGVALSSAQCGMGEASLLALAGKFDIGCTKKRRCVTSFSSGTGVAGVFGFLWKFMWHDWLGWSIGSTLLGGTSLAVCYAYVYLRWLHTCDPATLLVPGSKQYLQLPRKEQQSFEDRTCSQEHSLPARDQQQQQRQQQNEEAHGLLLQRGHGSVAPIEITGSPHQDDEEDEDMVENERYNNNNNIVSDFGGVRKVHDMSAVERLKLTLSLYPYMIPLFVVYAAEYALQAGTWTAIGFPVTSMEARDEFYGYSNWMYQAGVFLSRSSGTVYTAPLSVLWLMPVLQTINVIFFWIVAKHHIFYNWLFLMPCCFYVGLLGGGVYVNGYTRICEDLPLEHREFALSSTSVAESFGIVIADVIGLFMQACLYRANGLGGAIVSCPVKLR